MANKKITELPNAALPITTGVKFEGVQGGINVQIDADDMPGSAGVTSVTGTTNRVTSTGGATPVIDIDAAYDAIVAAKAPLASPTFTGTPAAPTAAAGTDTTQVATTAFVHDEIVGVQDLFIPAFAMWPMTTGGCQLLNQTEIATSNLNIQTLDFDQTTEEHAQFTIVLPRKCSLASFLYKIYWTASAGTAAQTVRWSVSTVAYSNDDPLTGTFSSAVAVDDALIATNDLHISPESAAVAIASGASEDLIGIMIHRSVGSDDLAADAKLIGMSLRLTTTSAIDS